MHIIFEITIYEIITLIFLIVGGIFTLIQYQKSIHMKKAGYLLNSLYKLRQRRRISKALHQIMYNKIWLNSDFFENIDKEADYDEVFAYFNYICYLRKNKLIGSEEFKLFEYRLRRMACSVSTMEYFYNLYHYAQYYNEDISFYYLFSYWKERGMILEDFWHSNSSLYKRYIF